MQSPQSPASGTDAIDAQSSPSSSPQPPQPSHAQLIHASTFTTPHYSSLNWRLDVQSHGRYVQEMNSVPTVIVQVETKSTIPSSSASLASPSSTTSSKTSQFQFEMDRTSVANVLFELEKIDKIMNSVQ